MSGQKDDTLCCVSFVFGFSTFVLILRTGDCNADISEQLLYQVKDLVLCPISTTLAL